MAGGSQSLFNRMELGGGPRRYKHPCTQTPQEEKHGMWCRSHAWGLGCFMEISEPVGHLETQGHSSMV